MSAEKNKLQKKLQLNGDALVTADKIHMLIDHCQAMKYSCFAMPRSG